MKAVQYIWMGALLGLPLSLGSVGCASGSARSTSSPDNSIGGTVDGDTPADLGSAEAQAFFEANVKSVLETNCASCHADGAPANGPDFLGASVDEMYTSLVANTRIMGSPSADGLLITKPAHAGPAYPEGDKASFREFVTLYNTEASEGGGAPPAVDLLAVFAANMDYDEFREQDVDEWADLQTTDGNCSSCHTPKFNNQDNDNINAYIDPGVFGTSLQEENRTMFDVHQIHYADNITDMGITQVGADLVVEQIPRWYGKLIEADDCAAQGGGAGCHTTLVNNNQRDKADELLEKLLVFLNSTKAKADQQIANEGIN